MIHIQAKNTKLTLEESFWVETEPKKPLARQDDKVGVGYDANVGMLRVSK